MWNPLLVVNMLPTAILHPTGSHPKNVIVSDFFGDIPIPKFFAMFSSVNTPSVNYPLNRLLWLDCLQKEKCLYLLWLAK